MKTARQIIDDILLNQPMQKDGETLEDFCERSEQRRINILTTWKEDICKKQRIEIAKGLGYKEGTIGYINIVEYAPEPT